MPELHYPFDGDDPAGALAGNFREALERDPPDPSLTPVERYVAAAYLGLGWMTGVLRAAGADEEELVQAVRSSYESAGRGLDRRAVDDLIREAGGE